MSRAYRISVSESIRRHVSVSDGIRTSLELLEVLPPEAMCDILAAELAARGFQPQGGQMIRVEDDGVEIAIDVSGTDAGHVTVRLARNQDLDITVQKSRQIYAEHAEEAKESLEQEVKRLAERREREAISQLSTEVTQTLERKLRDLGSELDRIANRVTAEALKARARQLGEIREISEDPETGSLTIKVKV